MSSDSTKDLRKRKPTPKTNEEVNEKPTSDNIDSHELKPEQNQWAKYCNDGLLTLYQSNFGKIILFFLSTIAACLAIAFLQVLSTNITGYNDFNLRNNTVNKTTCKCDCWDAFYRGKFPRESNHTFYKKFYFNYDQHIIYIIFVFVLYAELLKLLLSKLLKIVLNDVKVMPYMFSFSQAKPITQTRCLRLGVLFIMVFEIYTNYYLAWHIINFINDEDYRSLRTTIFSALTELMTTYVYFQCLDRYDLKSGTYKPIVNALSFPVLSVSLLKLCMYSHTKIGANAAEYFSLKYVNRADWLIDVFFTAKDTLGVLFALCVWYRVRNPAYKGLNKAELNGKGKFFYFIVWFLVTTVLYLLRTQVLTRIEI